MSDPRIASLAECWRKHGDLHADGESYGRMFAAMWDVCQRAYDAAHPHDKSAPPLVGADPPWLGHAAYAAHETFQNTSGYNTIEIWSAVTRAVLAFAARQPRPELEAEQLERDKILYQEGVQAGHKQPHPITEAMVEAASEAEAKHRLLPNLGGIRAALEAAERVRVQQP